MISSKILGSAVGIQYQGVKDLSETNNPATLTNGLVIGKFKRGFNKPFRVTKENYQALLGFDPTNPDYLTVEDAFNLGISELWIMRVGRR